MTGLVGWRGVVHHLRTGEAVADLGVRNRERENGCKKLECRGFRTTGRRRTQIGASSRRRSGCSMKRASYVKQVGSSRTRPAASNCASW